MKTPNNPLSSPAIIIVALVGMIASGCITNRIFSENDIVYSTKRFELKYDVRDYSRKSPLLYFRQTMVKEILPDKKDAYSAYDVLTLTGSGFNPEKKIFFIIENEAFPLKIDRVEYELSRKISEDRDDIISADSATVSVVTGYTENNRKITRFSYQIPAEIMARINGSDQFFIRYYTGPDLITIKPKQKSLRKIRQLYSMN